MSTTNNELSKNITNHNIIDKINNFLSITTNENSLKIYNYTKNYIDKKNKLKHNIFIGPEFCNIISTTNSTMINQTNMSGEFSMIHDLKKNLLDVLRLKQLEIRKKYLLTNDDLNDVLKKMVELSTIELDDYWLSFENYTKIRQYMGELIGSIYLPYYVYGQLYQNNKNGWIGTFSLYKYLNKKAAINQLRYSLTIFDNSDGYIKNSDFHIFIVKYLQDYKNIISHLGQKYLPFYICNITSWFQFFFDPLHDGRMKINKVVTSGFFDLIDEANTDSQTEQNTIDKNNEIYDDSPLVDDFRWFSTNQTIRIYNIYLLLDQDTNGMISNNEFKQFLNGIFTDSFVAQLFNNVPLYDKQMDYRSFVLFIIAHNNSHTPQGCHFFFKILDVDHDGYIGLSDINYFYRDIYNIINNYPDMNPIPFEEIVSEIFDMIQPKDPDRFTLKELIQSNQSSTIINMLISSEGFVSYECQMSY